MPARSASDAQNNNTNKEPSLCPGGERPKHPTNTIEKGVRLARVYGPCHWMIDGPTGRHTHVRGMGWDKIAVQVFSSPHTCTARVQWWAELAFAKRCVSLLQTSLQCMCVAQGRWSMLTAAAGLVSRLFDLSKTTGQQGCSPVTLCQERQGHTWTLPVCRTTGCVHETLKMKGTRFSRHLPQACAFRVLRNEPWRGVVLWLSKKRGCSDQVLLQLHCMACSMYMYNEIRYRPVLRASTRVPTCSQCQ